MFNKSRSKFNETINNTLQQPSLKNSCANNKKVARGAVLSLCVAGLGVGLSGGVHSHVGQGAHCNWQYTQPLPPDPGYNHCGASQDDLVASTGYLSGAFVQLFTYTISSGAGEGTPLSLDVPASGLPHFHNNSEQNPFTASVVAFPTDARDNLSRGGVLARSMNNRTRLDCFVMTSTLVSSASANVLGYLANYPASGGAYTTVTPAGEIYCATPAFRLAKGFATDGPLLPGNVLFSAPSLAEAIIAGKGSKNAVRMGNSGFAPIGNGSLIGVGYDRGDKSLRDHGANDFSGNEYRVHLDFLKGHGNTFYGLAGEYRKGKFTLDSSGDKYETEYYGPRVDVGWRGMNSWMQLSGAYLFGNAKFNGDKENGNLVQAGFLAQMNKQINRKLTLEPGVDVQYIWQKLGTIGAKTYKNRNYGRADFNLGLGITLVRGWSISPNVGYRWDIEAACTQVGAGAKVCEPTADGVRYGVQLAKAIMRTGSKWDNLAVSAYYDYFKKDGLKQNVWGVLAQYPF